MAVVNFTGTWKLEKDENFDEFLKAIGVGGIKRKIVTSLTPTVVIEHDGNNVKIATKTSLKTQEVLLVIGAERIQKDPLDEKKEFRVKDYMDGDKLVSEVIEGNGVIISREIVDGKLIFTQTKGEVTCKRTFKKA